MPCCLGMVNESHLYGDDWPSALPALPAPDADLLASTVPEELLPLGLDGDSMGIMGVAMSVSMVCWDMGPLLVDDVPSGN